MEMVLGMLYGVCKLIGSLCTTSDSSRCFGQSALTHLPGPFKRARARRARVVVTKRLELMEVVHKLPNSLATSYNTSNILSIISISRESGACASAHPTCPGPFKPARACVEEGGRHKAPGAVRGGAGALKQLGYLIQHL